MKTTSLDLLEQIPIEKVAEEHGTPLIVYSREIMEYNLSLFRQFLPQVQPFYAVKANDNLEIIDFFRSKELCFDVASAGEIRKCMARGVSAEDMVFSHPIKKIEDIRFAREVGVRFLVVDSYAEIDKVSQEYPEADILVRFRLRVKDSQCLVNLSIKFGADMERVGDLIEYAIRKGLRVIGVSFHVGSQINDASIFLEALDRALGIHTPYPYGVLDIGGGFPVPDFNTLKDHSFFKTLASQIVNKLQKFEGKVIAEPGRFLVATSALLITKVIGLAQRDGKWWYYLDDGVYGALSGMLYDHWDYNFIPISHSENEAKFVSVLAGPTCDSVDILKRSIELPKLKLGDLIVVPNVGAYTTVSASGFNGFGKPKEIFID